MKELSLSEKILILLGLVFSAAGVVSMLTLPDPPPLSRMLLRLGIFGALYSCLWLLTLCWAATLVFVLRMKGPSLYRAGIIPFGLGGILLVFFFLGNRLSYAGVMLTSQAALVPLVARRLASIRFTTQQEDSALPAANSISSFGK